MDTNTARRTTGYPARDFAADIRNAPEDFTTGACLNCGEKAAESGTRATRHTGSGLIACAEPTIGSGTCAALTDH